MRPGPDGSATAPKPNASIHQYQQSCTVEQRWAPRLDAWLGESYTLREATLAEQRGGIDRFACDGDGCHAIDYKCDEKWAVTGNVFIETMSNAQSGRPGWAVTSAAEWLLYYLTPDRVLVLTFAMVRRHLPRWQAAYKTRPARNAEGYDTLGVCVPVSAMTAVAEYVARLDQCDAAILARRDTRRMSEGAAG